MMKFLWGGGKKSFFGISCFLFLGLFLSCFRLLFFSSILTCSFWILLQ